jgi:hypothetical protein
VKFLKSLLANREAVVADTVITYDLPVNPLSMVHIDVEAKQSVVNVPATQANIGAIFDKVEVLFKGSSVISLSGLDLLAYGSLLMGKRAPILNRRLEALSENVYRFSIPFGRIPYGPDECFPAVRRGELQLRLDYASAFTNIESLDAVITTIELPEAAPARFLKATTLAKTLVVGANDIDLPLGNRLLGLLLFSTTVPTTTLKTTTVDLLKLLVDNVEQYSHEIRWPELAFEFMRKIGMDQPNHTHTHVETAGSTEEDSVEDVWFKQFGLLDFDPLVDGSFLLETAGSGRVWVRITGGDAAAARVIPVEIMELGQ